MRKFKTAIFAAMIAAFVGVGFASAAEEKKAETLDLSTPEKAVAAWLKAYRTSDFELFKKVVIYNELNETSYDISVAQQGSACIFTKKMEAKFGKDFSKDTFFEGLHKKAQKLLAIDLTGQKAEVKGDTATFKNPMTSRRRKVLDLKKVDGKWKVDYSADPITPIPAAFMPILSSNIGAIEYGIVIVDQEGMTVEKIFGEIQRQMQILLQEYQKQQRQNQAD